MYKTADAGATAALLGKLCVERGYVAKLDDVRTGIQQRLVVSGAGGEFPQSGRGRSRGHTSR